VGLYGLRREGRDPRAVGEYVTWLADWDDWNGKDAGPVLPPATVRFGRLKQIR
jgi:hypothetical protein